MKVLLFAALLLLAPSAAFAQKSNVVTSCGAMTPGASLTPGSYGIPTVDTNGNLCLALPSGGSSSSGGGGLTNPITTFHCAGVITATTGGITAGTASLTVASAASWKVNQGIKVAGAGPSGAPLITSVSGIAGATLTLAGNASTTVSGAAVLHDDTACLQTALASGQAIRLIAGNYNVGGTITVSQPATLIGDGAWASIIWNTGTANDVFRINYGEDITAPTPTKQSSLYEDFQINQTAGVTPTAGYGFNLGGTPYLSKLHISRIVMNNLWGGMYVGSGMITNWFSDIAMNSFVGGNGIYLNDPSPAGDLHFDGIEMRNPNTGVTINAGDTSEFTNLKTNYSGVTFTGTPATIFRMRFIDASIEGPFGGPACGIDFGSGGVKDIEFIGGEIALWGGPWPYICNMDKNLGGVVQNMVTEQEVPVNLGPIIGAPTDGHGSCAMVTAPVSLKQGVGTFAASACAAGTISLVGLPTTENGYNCFAANRTHPDSSHLVIQQGAYTTGAIFTANTAANDVIQYSCQAY